MFRLIPFTFRTIFSLKLAIGGFAAGLATAFALQQRTLYRSWGLVEGGSERDLAGDDLVPGADVVETRSIDIDAAPGEVWPWLLQLGYGRGGWYGYAVLDRPWRPGPGPLRRSADVILERFQDLAEGDLVPVYEGGGFVVRRLEPGRALVLYLDDRLMREQAVEATADMDVPPYAVSWAFVLEELAGGRTRLVERLRMRMADLSADQRRAVPLMSFGAFVLLRSQLLGIRQRAEAAVSV